MKALILNCTLKKTPDRSHTEALVKSAVKEFKKLDVECELIRVVDFNILPGVDSDMGEGDDWPKIIKKIRECQIVVIGTPIWVGGESSMCQRIIERLDAMFYDKKLQDPNNGQYIFYNKVAGVVVTGNEDGAQAVHARLFMALNEFGATIPPNVGSYWVGEAGPGPSYIDGGQSSKYTQRITVLMVQNLVAMAKILEATPIQTNLSELNKLYLEE
jgi:multimeric flavodoxin WrbA